MQRPIKIPSYIEKLMAVHDVHPSLVLYFQNPYQSMLNDIDWEKGNQGGAKVVFMHTLVKDELAEQKRIDEIKNKITNIDIPYRKIHYFGLALYIITFVLGILGFSRFFELPLKISVILIISSIIFLFLFITASYEATRRRRNTINDL